MFSEKTSHPLWRIVRKSVAQAFAVNNMRCACVPSLCVHCPCKECIAAAACMPVPQCT